MPGHDHKRNVGKHQTHICTKKQATQHDCLPSLLADGDKIIEIVSGGGKKYFVLGRLEQPRQN
jgi:hypothetical protein